MEEENPDENQQAPTSMVPKHDRPKKTDQRKGKPHKSSHRVHSGIGTDSKDVSPPPVESSSDYPSYSRQKNSKENSKKCVSPANGTANSKDDRSLSKQNISDNSGSGINTNDDQQPVSSQDLLLKCVKNGDRARIESLPDFDVNKADEKGLTALHYAARAHFPEIVQILLDKGADVNKKSTDKCKWTPLIYACQNKAASNRSNTTNKATSNNGDDDQVQVVEKLLHSGANLNEKDTNGMDALHHLAHRRSEEMCKRLTTQIQKARDSDVDVNRIENEGNTPLMLASRYGNIQFMEFLIRHDGCIINKQNTNNGYTALHYASYYGKKKAVVKLLEHGKGDLNVIVDKAKKTALHLACENNHRRCARILKALKTKTVLNQTDLNGYTPFMLAVTKDNRKIVQEMMNWEDNDPCVKLVDGRNILHLVAERNLSGVLEILMGEKLTDAEKANTTDSNPSIVKVISLINEKEKCDGRTPLHTAIHCGHDGLFSLLLKYGALPYTLDKNRQTPFHIASAKGFIRIIDEMAMQNHVFLKRKDKNGDTMFHLAAREGLDRVLEVLLRADKENVVSPKDRNKDQCTPLWVAAASGHAKCVELLSFNSKGSLLNEANKNKLTPLMIASQNGHVEVVDLLIREHANVFKVDKAGHNSLDIAILNGHESVALTIIKSNEWETALRNYTAKDDMECTPFRKLVKRMPDTALAVLDRCINSGESSANSTDEKTDELKPTGKDNENQENKSTSNTKKTSKEYLARFNFEFVDDLYHITEWMKQTEIRKRDMEATETQYSYRENDEPKAYGNNFDKVKDQHPIMIMSDAERLDLLVHPVTRALCEHKWKTTSKYFYFYFCCYALYLSFLTAYVIMTPPPFAISQSSCDEYFDSGYRRSPNLYVIKICLYVFIGINIYNQLGKIISRRKQYLNIYNIMKITILVTRLLFVIDFDGCQLNTNYRYTWQWNIGAISIVLSWFEIFTFLIILPKLGTYIIMFITIFGTFIKFSIVFFILIVGFGLGFFCLLQNQTSFSTVPNALLRTTVMMIGELDFNGVFHDDMVHYGITYVLFCVFLIMMTIVVMNLLIGLAIGDIQAVQDHAKLSWIQLNMEITLDMERGVLILSKGRFFGRLYRQQIECVGVYVKSYKSKADMNKAVFKFQNQVEQNQHEVMHKVKKLKKTMKTMKIEMDKQGVILEEIKRKLFEEMFANCS